MGGSGAVYPAAQPEEGHAKGRGMRCAGRVAAVRIVACRPAGAPSASRTWSSRSQDALDGPAASGCHRGRDHDQDGRDDDADDPPDPVDAARRLNPERCGEVVADEHAADPADNGQPEWNVVAVARREELAQQADDDAGDDYTDDVHRRPLSLLGRPGSTAFASTRPAEGSISDGNHGTTEGCGPFAEHLKGPTSRAGHGTADPAGLILAVGGHMAKQAGELGTRVRAGSPPSDEVR